MKKTVLNILLVAALGATQARADFDPVPLTPSSFTSDVVVEAAAPKPLSDYTTATMDGGTNNDSQVWFEQGFDVTRPTTGVPAAGAIFAAQDNPSRTFKMPPSYSAANAVLLTTSGHPSATINLTTPTAASALSILGSVSGGDITLNYTVNFQGGGTEVGTVVIQDWFNRATAIALTANGRVNVSNGQTDNQYGNNPRMHYADIFLADTVNPVTSIQLTTTSGARVALFGMSVSSDNVTFTPVDITGFNRDMVVENTAPISSLYTKNNVIMDGGGTNLTGNTWYEVGFNKNAPTTGLPAAGSDVSGGTPLHTFTMPPNYTANNVLYVGNFEGYTTGTLTLSSPTTLAGLSFLGAAGNGPVNVSVTVNFADASAEFFNFGIADWFGGDAAFYTVNGRFNPVSLALNDVNSGNPRLRINDIVLANTGSPVTSIQITYTSGGRAMIFAVAGQVTPGGTFSPVPVTGFNADGVVEAGAFRFPAAYFAATSATMDGGTNFTGGINNAWTWYEQGYFRNRPETGLPAAGSTITSLSLPDHHYQMPASYVGNNAIFVDATYTNANITPAAPQAYSALSFLSTCASGTATNQVIMQYADGTSETNTFISRDWFGGTPYAFTARGRTDVNRRTVGSVGSDNPRLYEAQFALANTVSPVTNMVLRWLGGSGANTRMFVFAVSGTAGSVPPIISSVSISAGTVFEGSNVTFNAIITGGTEPISYQWQKGTNGVYVNVNNGGNITGATTTNMIITATPADIADYRLVASNVNGPVNSGVVTLQRVLSTLPDITAPGDVITLIAGTTPANENVQRVVDNTTSKYLNFDADAVSPFVGPVGFTIQPASGNTIVSALRFYTANDSDGRDPADYLLEGSLDGVSFTPISSGALALPTGRNAGGAALAPLTQNIQEVQFANSTGYTHYRLSINNVRNNAGENNTQIGEIEILGIANPNPPPAFTIVPTDVAANENADATFTSLATGPGPITYQWYDVTGGDPGVAIGGNSANLTLPNVTVAQSGSRYRVVATNPNGSTTSPSIALPGAELTVTSGAPFVTQDLPLEELGYAGRTLTLSAVFGGTAPTYQWQSNGVNLVNSDRVSGATSSTLSIANLQPGDAATYQLLANNSFGGPIATTPTTVYVTTTPTFQGNGLGWTFNNLGGGGSFFLAPDQLVMTTSGGQQRSAWLNPKMQVNAFKASFQYQDVTTAGADGFAFVIQNAVEGTAAIGGGGGGLAYSGITDSVALTFNIFGTPGMTIRTNGTAGGPYAETTPVNIADGSIIQVDLHYDGLNLAVTLSNTASAATFTTNYVVGDITEATGSDLAYVGFTAATGGVSAEQHVSNFRFIPIPSATATAAGSDVLLTWPGTIGGYGVATSSTVTGTYTPIPGFVGQTNGLFQKVVTPGPGNSFYRLVLPLP